MRFDDFFRQATGRPPYEYQRRFATAPQLPDLLEAPTGSGKTATAVVGWLWRRCHGSAQQRWDAGRRLVFCLPMRTLVEQTHSAVQTWLMNLEIDANRVRVAMLLGGATADKWDEHPDVDAILIGTQDQLLSRALMRGYAMSRYRWPIAFALLHNDCTWVMDEVQLMGVGASTAAQLQAFREHFPVVGSVKTVWMTATLDEGKLRTVDLTRRLTRQRFSTEEPALQARLEARKTLLRSRATVTAKDWLDVLAHEIVEAHEPGTLTIAIVNRVPRAQQLYSQLRRLRPAMPVALVHSRFRPVDRRRIESSFLNGFFRGVLVATQAIEAGVDISAKTLFTELAPWPSLIQRWGRLNRQGEHIASRAFWVDIDTSKSDSCVPYAPADLVASRARLETVDDVGPRSLASMPSEPTEPTLPVIRKRDLIELFDTEPDLAGHDVDVSRYVRGGEDRDVYVAWRTLGRRPPADDAPDVHRDELCAVPLHRFRKAAAKAGPIWRFDALHARWVQIEPQRLFTGLSVVVDVGFGGYDEHLGFTGEENDVPDPVIRPGETPESDADDRLTNAGEFVSLLTHSEDVLSAMRSAMPSIADLLTESELRVLLESARWHDYGKAHPAFQSMLTSGLPSSDPRKDAGPWAKSDGRTQARNERRFFRHELVSALSWLQCGGSDLGAFLIAAHHGKIRLSLRARPGEEGPVDGSTRRFAHGVWEGDRTPAADMGGGVCIPEQTLSLASMELGDEATMPWAERTQTLLDEYGPFRLAYLEMLLRVADWRGSAMRVARSEVAGA